MSNAHKIRSNLAGVCETCGDILSTLDISNLNITPSLITLGVGIIDSLSEDYMSEGFIERTWEWWPKVFSRDEAFWSENCQSIFPEMPDNYASDFVRILANPNISPNDRDKVWRLIQGAVRCSIRYVHEKREPYIRNGELAYKRRYMSQINLRETAAEWGINLQV